MLEKDAPPLPLSLKARRTPRLAQITVHMPFELAAQVEQMAKHSCRPLSQYVCWALTQFMKRPTNE